MIEEVIAILLDTGATGSRVYPVRLPQASPMPAIVVTTISNIPVYSDDGESGLSSGRVQVDCWGDTYSSAKTVARAVKASLSAYQGGIFQNVLLDAERDLSESGSNSSEYRFRTSLDFIVWFAE